MPAGWDTRRVPVARDTLAPDGSEIRLLPAVERGSMVHCTLPMGAVTRAVRHRTVDELWLCLGGTGEVWRRRGQIEETVGVETDVALSIPVGTAFQFRAGGPEPLRLVIVTMPPWPGDAEAELVEGPWAPSPGDAEAELVERPGPPSASGAEGELVEGPWAPSAGGDEGELVERPGAAT